MHVANNKQHGRKRKRGVRRQISPAASLATHFVSLETPGAEDQALFLQYETRKEKEREKKKGKKRAKVQLKCFRVSCVSLQINN